MSSSVLHVTLWERILEWYRGSFLDRIFTFLGEQVFGVVFWEYSKISLPPSAGVTARNLIVAFLIAFWVAAIASCAVKATYAAFLRRLIAGGALDEAHALTLAELGCSRRSAIRRDLARGGALAKLLCRPGDSLTVAGTPIPEEEPETTDGRPSLAERLSDTPAKEKKEEAPAPSPAPVQEKSEPEAPAPLNLDADRFYLPAALRARAELRFARRGSGVLAAVLAIVASTVLAVLLCRFLPVLFWLANKLLGG